MTKNMSNTSLPAFGIFSICKDQQDRHTQTILLNLLKNKSNDINIDIVLIFVSSDSMLNPCLFASLPSGSGAFEVKTKQDGHR